MNIKLKNIADLFKNTRTRTIIVFTGIVILIAIIVSVVRLTKSTSGPAATATVETSPSIQSIPGGFDQSTTAEYARLQEQQNVLQAKIAEKQGTSAIPTIISATSLQGKANTAAGCCNPCPCPGGMVAVKGNTPPLVSSPLKPGTLVYDAQGRVIGTVGADGKVRDANGKIIGTVGPDGLVHDVNGNIVGAAASATAGTPAYDSQGRLIGTVSTDGKIRDANGNVVGTIDADGTVRDNNGNVIGKTADFTQGTPVYDAQGKLIGTVRSDGKVRDANGNVIGTVDAAGKVRDAKGNIIGQAAKQNATANTPGAAVYDAQGKLIGTVGPDGKVRDAKGDVIGSVGTDGVVRDAKGNIIGKASSVVPGAPVYDEQGKLIGTVGPDGKVRDANGKVIGLVGPDGVVRGPDGKLIGKTGPTAPGTPVYDAQGRLIGTVGADGIVRDSTGRAVGTVGLDGNVRDIGGQIIGSTTPGGSATAAGNETSGSAAAGSAGSIPSIQSAQQQSQNPELQAILQRQQNLISQQQAEQVKSQMQGAMANQTNQLLTSWASPTQQYVAGTLDADLTGKSTRPGARAAGGAGEMAGIAAAAATAPIAVKAGTVMYGVLQTSVNSDEPGPVLATIVGGKFKGGKLIGALTNQGQKVMLSFNTLTMPNASKSITVNVVAIDPETARTAFSSDTDNHYFMRYGSVFAASFLQGFGQAIQTSGQTVNNVGLTTQTVNPTLSTQKQIFVGLGAVGQKFSQVLSKVFDTPPTVYVNSGTSLGILFLSDVSAVTELSQQSHF